MVEETRNAQGMSAKPERSIKSAGVLANLHIGRGKRSERARYLRGHGQRQRCRESRCDLRWRSAQHGGTTSSQLISVNSPENKKDLRFPHAPQVDCEPKKHVSEFFVRFEFRRPRACTCVEK